MINYPYSAKIKVTLSIGYSGAEREGVICPEIDSFCDEEEWNALSEKEREDWVNCTANDWSQSYITLEYAVVKPFDFASNGLTQSGTDENLNGLTGLIDVTVQNPITGSGIFKKQ